MRQQLAELTGLVRGQSPKLISQVGMRIEPIELGHLNESTGWRASDGHCTRRPWIVSKPAANQVGIEAMGQRQTGHRRTRLLTGQNDLVLEFWHMVAPGALRWSALYSVHLLSRWTPSSRFRLGRSRRLHRTHTLAQVPRLMEGMLPLEARSLGRPRNILCPRGKCGLRYANGMPRRAARTSTTLFKMTSRCRTHSQLANGVHRSLCAVENPRKRLSICI
jgi:hypothetical protein